MAVLLTEYGAEGDDFLASTFEDQGHECVEQVDIPDDICGETVGELLCESSGILAEDGEGIKCAPRRDQSGIGDDVVEGAGGDGGGVFGGFLHRV
jgi:hypothetical protein